MQPLKNDAATALLRATTVNFLNFGPDCTLQVEAFRTRPWASVTFNGARQELAFRIEGPGASEAAALFAASLDDAEFKLRGHFVADIKLISSEACDGGVRLELEALTVEE